MTRIESIMEGEQLTPYTAHEIIEAFPIPEVKKLSKNTPSEERDTPRYDAKNDNLLA